MLRYLVAIACLLCATTATAEPSAMSGEAIKEVVSGALVEVDTPLGTRLPIHHSEDGRLAGEARGLAYILGSQSDSGKWWVSSDRLCHKWLKWFDGKVQCMRLAQGGSRIFWRRDDGETGTAVISTRSAARTPEIARHEAAREMPGPEDPTSSSFASATVLPRAVPQQMARADSLPERGLPDGKRVLKSSPLKQDNTEDLVPGQSATKARPAAAPKQTPSIEPNRAGPARPVQSFRVWGVALHDVLNVRSGPSADHTAIGAILPDAAGVRIVGECVAEWCPVAHRGITGWVNALYLIEDAR